MRGSRGALALVVSALLAVGLLGVPTAQAQVVAQSAVVSADPANWTPNVLDGSVKSIAQIGNTIVLGGAFSQVQAATGGPVLPRNNVVAFNATTGAISTAFAPSADGEVTTVLAAPDGRSVYLGGFFSTVNGAASKGLARVDVATGALVGGFTAPALDGWVKDLRLVAGRLWIGGTFTRIAGRVQPALGTVNAETGAFDSYMSLVFAGPRNDGILQAMKQDVTSDGSRMAVIGNFSTVDGQSRPQLAMLDLSGPSARLADWATQMYNAQCSPSFDSYMRDLDFSPDGSFFVVSTTGAYSQGRAPCDTTIRWETGATGTAVAPTWVNHTGGDTTYAVAVTGSAVYAGGHFRWQNNPFRGDQAGQGAVAREGIAALDPANGLPLSWNPGRDKGVGVFDMLATPAGLWVASDTDRIGRWEYHARVAFFPLAGGSTPPANETAGLPGHVFLAGSATGSQNLRFAWHDGTTAQAPSQVDRTGINWNSVRGAVMIDGDVYTGNADGSFTRRSFDATSLGAAVPIDGADQLVRLTNWYTEVNRVTGMFFDSGRLYYTLFGTPALYYRYLTPESRVVGAQRFQASGNVTGIAFDQVAGMFLSGSQLYFATDLSGVLNRIDWVGGAPVPGTAVQVSDPGTDGIDWRSRGMFVYTGDNLPRPNKNPVADPQITCESLTCTVDGAGSTDPDGSVASYTWDFGDGTAPVSGATSSHTYDDDGTYTVTLTVIDDLGATATSSRQVTVTWVNAEPTASFDLECALLDCTVDGSGSADPDGSIASYVWDFGDGAAASGATASHRYGTAGEYEVTLTVTDGQGGSSSTSETVRVSETDISYVGGSTVNANGSSFQVTVPQDVAAGDGLLLMATTATTVTAGTSGGVSGWEVVSSVGMGGTNGSTTVWQKVAAAGDAGKPVTVSLSGLAKTAVTLLAYRGTSATDPVEAVTAAAETQSRAAHATPAVPVTRSGSVVVSYWADRTSATTAWTAPAGETVRSESFGAGGGRIGSLVTDSGSAVPVGSRAGLTATANSSTARATMVSLALVPRG